MLSDGKSGNAPSKPKKARKKSGSKRRRSSTSQEEPAAGKAKRTKGSDEAAMLSQNVVNDGLPRFRSEKEKIDLIKGFTPEFAKVFFGHACTVSMARIEQANALGLCSGGAEVRPVVGAGGFVAECNGSTSIAGNLGSAQSASFGPIEASPIAPTVYGMHTASLTESPYGSMHVNQSNSIGHGDGSSAYSHVSQDLVYAQATSGNSCNGHYIDGNSSSNGYVQSGMHMNGTAYANYSDGDPAGYNAHMPSYAHGTSGYVAHTSSYVDNTSGFADNGYATGLVWNDARNNQYADNGSSSLAAALTWSGAT